MDANRSITGGLENTCGVASTDPRPLRTRVARTVLVAWIALLPAIAMADGPRELHLGSDEWPPFTGSPGTPRAANELVHTALHNVGVEETTEIADWKVVESKIRGGELDGSAAMWKSARREESLLFSEPYLENRLMLVGRAGSDVSAKSMNDLAGKRVALVSRYAYGPEVNSAAGVHYVPAKSDQDSLDKLLAGDVDYMLVDELVIRHLMAAQPDEVEANLAIGLNPLVRRTLHFAIRKDIPDAQQIISAFNTEIHTMQANGTYGQILQVGWIRADVDGDGLYELVPVGDQLGELPPSSVFDVFGKAPEDTPPEKERVVVQGNIYKGWDAIPDQFKGPPSPSGQATQKYGTTLMTLKF